VRFGSSLMHTHHTHPNRAEPRKRNIPKVSIRHGDAGISPHSQKESGHQAKKSDERLPNAVLEGAALVLAQRPRIFFSIARKAKTLSQTGGSCKLPSVMFSLPFDSITPFHVPSDKPCVETFTGAAC
jgi:hypothetical protein